MPDLTLGRPNIQVFAETLLELARADRNILVVTSDSRGSGQLTAFGQELPDQLVEVGIAEANLVGAAAGLAAMGKHVFAVSPASFLTARALEQIKNDVAYSDRPVKLVGISAGVSYGALGTTHHTLHDYAVLQAFHNIDIIAPADAFETEQTVRAAVYHPRPLYLRLGKRAQLALHPAGDYFSLGKAAQLTPAHDHYDAALIAIGEAVQPAYLAAAQLHERGLTCCVLSVHGLRPLDEQAVLTAARLSRAIVTVEEHSIYGGLGSRVAGLLMTAGVFRPLHIVGLPDEHLICGSQAEIFAQYGLTPEGIAQSVLTLLAGEAR